MSVDIEPGSPEWMKIVTPSKVSAILGVSRYESPYRLWHRMKGITPGEPERDIFDMGHDFEPAAAAIWKRKNPGWQLSPGEVQIVADGGFDFPAMATLDRRARRGRARKIVEFKTVRHLEEWGDLFTDQAPADYVAQVMAQMMFTGYADYPAELLVLGPYFQAHTYYVEYDSDVAWSIHQRCDAFYDSLDGDTPPALDDSVASYQCVREQHPDIESGSVEVDPPLAESILHYSLEVKELETHIRGFKTRLLDAMGNAKTATCNGVIIAERRPHGKGGVALNLNTKNLDQLRSTTEGDTAA